MNELLMQFEFVRRSGMCNMFDRCCVLGMAIQNDFAELSTVASVRRSYGDFLGSVAQDYQVNDVDYEMWLAQRGLDEEVYFIGEDGDAEEGLAE